MTPSSPKKKTKSYHCEGNTYKPFSGKITVLQIQLIASNIVFLIISTIFFSISVHARDQQNLGSASASVDAVQFKPSLCMIPTTKDEYTSTLDNSLQLNIPIGTAFASGTLWTAV